MKFQSQLTDSRMHCAKRQHVKVTTKRVDNQLKKRDPTGSMIFRLAQVVAQQSVQKLSRRSSYFAAQPDQPRQTRQCISPIVPMLHACRIPQRHTCDAPMSSSFDSRYTLCFGPSPRHRASVTSHAFRAFVVCRPGIQLTFACRMSVCALSFILLSPHAPANFYLSFPSTDTKVPFRSPYPFNALT
jgi:hypothetical protein